jgi:hypothetical protein
VLFKCCTPPACDADFDLTGAIGTGIPSASNVFFLSPHAGTEGGAVEMRGFDEAADIHVREHVGV